MHLGLEILKSLGTTILPSACLGCQAPLSDTQLGAFCAVCLETLPCIEQACSQCARPLKIRENDSSKLEKSILCGSCQRDNPAFDITLTSRPYAPPFSGWLSQYKYHRQVSIGGALIADWLAENTIPRFAPDLLVPVPLHPKRQRKRGFNQAMIFAQRIAQIWHVPLATNLVHRALNTPPLHEIRAQTRAKVMRQAFAISPQTSKIVAGKSVAIVDDILTSGATADALAKLLKHHGAESVSVYVLTRAVD